MDEREKYIFKKMQYIYKDNDDDGITARFDKVLQDEYNKGYEDGLEDREDCYEPEPIPWEDLD
jgi:hypothetical protein